MARLFLRFTGRQVLLIARDRQLLFWNWWFFLILLVLFLAALSGGDASVRVTLTVAIVTVGIMANALFSLAVGLTTARERGVFRRYALTPVPSSLPVAGTVCARALMVCSAAIAQVVVAHVVFHVPWTGGVSSWIAIVMFGTSAFVAVGFAIASLAPSPHVANTIANLVFIPMMALGGTALPASMMPDAWASVYWVLPPATMTAGLLGAFVAGETAADHLPRLLYLALWTIVPAAWGAYRWIRRGP